MTIQEKRQQYHLMKAQLSSLLEGCSLPLPALSNCAALLWASMEGINWAGFYLLREETLYLGPFQGKPACVIIPVGRGVCGTAVAQRMVQRVADVHAFPGHIACDCASNSEIVLPLEKDGKIFGVMDIDSPHLRRFDETDETGLTALCHCLMDSTDWTKGVLG